MRTDAGHIEGRHDTLGFAEVIPPDPGDFEDSQSLRTKREHLVGKVYFFQDGVEFVDVAGFFGSS